MSINNIYLSSGQMEAGGIHVFSTEEKTRVQAREHKNPKKQWDRENRSALTLNISGTGQHA